MNKLIRNIYIAQAAIVFTIYAITFSFSPMQGEDYGLTKHFTNESVFERIAWALSRSLTQIETWNARLGEQLSILTLSMPDVFFMFVATLVFLSIVIAIQNTIIEKINIFIFSSSIIVVLAFWPGMELFLWRTAITGYTLPMTITILTISQFINAKRRQATSYSNTRLLFVITSYSIHYTKLYEGIIPSLARMQARQ